MSHVESNRTLRSRATVLACLTAGLVAAVAAQSASAADATRVPVRYTAQELATDRGADAVYARIVAAARSACGESYLDIRDLQAVAAAHACERVAVAHAVDAVHSTRLATTYEAHLGHI